MTDHPEPTLPVSLAYRVATLSARKPTRFRLKPNAAERAAMAQALDLLDLPFFEMKGEIIPEGRNDYRLTAQMKATVVQACAVTLAPVKTELTEDVLRRYDADFTVPDGDEVELTGDDTTEALPEVIDAGIVAMEALTLALPLYPRAPGAKITEAVFAAPGVAPIRDEDLRPFAGLAALKNRLEGGEDKE